MLARRFPAYTRDMSVTAPVSRARINEVLTPYVPRLVVDWLRETPTALHREVEGSMVFVDISGFTALSERLARRGKIGAELLRDALNVVFTALLDDAYDYGAGLLKWGGDALLLLFDGERHEERACRAAWEMQQTLGRVGRLKAGSATVTLRMSAGITTGTFQLVLAGSVHHELLIAGPAVTETVATEAIADAGEIAVSADLAARLHPACVGAPKDAALLLASPPEVDGVRAPEIGDVSEIDIPSCIPVASRAHVLLERSEPEHRTITAAFIDLLDTDLLLERFGLDALAGALDERLRTIQEIALRYEVPFYESDVGKGSVKVLLTAGAPTSTGHDEERMLRALREIVDTPGVIPVRVGVNTGKVFTGDFGPSYRRSYRVFGDAINTAARVMSKAAPGQILCTDIVLERSRTTFAATPIEPFAAKGKAEPVRASAIGAVEGTKEADRSRTPLIGRETELDAVLRVVEQARGGQGWVVELAGGAGLGKSRLVDEVIARSPDVTVLRARCEEYEASTPYFPLRTLMRSVLGIERDDGPEETERRLREIVERSDPGLVAWVPLLGILLGLALADTPETAALDERFLRERLGEVTMQFLFTLLAGTPTMIAVEDVHFMDEASRDLLLRLARANAELRHVILVTNGDRGSPWAPGDDELIRTLALCLLPLPLPRLIAIAERATDDDPLSPHDIEEIARRAGGNALFLFELLEEVRKTGTVEALPDSVESLIAGDIDRLSPEDRTVLRYAAVLGTSFEPDLLADAVRAEVSLDPGVWERLGDFVDAEPSGTWRFRNTLIRDAAYEGLPYRRRRELHGRVGEAIERRALESPNDEAATLSLHFFEAQRWDAAWEHCRRAGRRAMEIYANVEAARSFERASVAGRRLRRVPVAELAAVHELVGDARFRLGEFERAARAFRAASRLLRHDSAAAGRLALKEAQIPLRLGKYPSALRRVTRGLRALEGVRGRAAGARRARLLSWYGAVRYRQNRFGEAIEWCLRAEQEAIAARAKEALAHAYQIHDLALLARGQTASATFGPRALAIYEELGDLWQQAATLNNMGQTAYQRSDWNASRDLTERARALWLTTGDRWAASFATFNIGEMLSDQGRYSEAEPLLREALRVWKASGAETDVADAERELGKLLARQGCFLEARSLLESARATHARHGQHGEVLATRSRLAEALVLEHRGDEAGPLADELLRQSATAEGGSAFAPLLQRVRGWALLQSGRTEEAAAAFETALQLARARSALYEVGLSLEGLLALDGRLDGEETRALALERDEIFARLGVVATPAIPVEDRRRRRSVV